jgi:hypothetical protein
MTWSNIVPIETAQAAIISYLKSIPALIAILGNASQIKEYFWQGTDFVYPGVRLQMVGGFCRSMSYVSRNKNLVNSVLK